MPELSKPLMDSSAGDGFGESSANEAPSARAAVAAGNFGGKTIGFGASVCLLINNITGPGVPGIPNQLAESGWLVPVLVFLLVWAMSSLSTAMFCESMRRVPGNEGFSGRMEYTTVISHYFGRRGYLASMAGLNGALMTLNIISVVQSAQVMDQTIAQFFGKSCGLNLTPFALQRLDDTSLPESSQFWSCANVNEFPPDPWGCHVIITAGFVVVLAMAIPMGWYNLDDNMPIQVVAFCITACCWFLWAIVCAFASPDMQNPAVQLTSCDSVAKPCWSDISYIETSNKTGCDPCWDPAAPGLTANQFTVTIPTINTEPGVGSMAGIIGTVLFNFGFVTTVPSWVNEKRKSVSVNRTVWMSTTMCVLIFLGIGLPGAMAFKYYLAGPSTNTCAYERDMLLMGYTNNTGCAASLLDVLTQSYTYDGVVHPAFAPAMWWDSPGARGLMKATVFIFPVVAIVSSIPVFSIVIKYNCIESGWSPRWAFVWGVLGPWIISIPLLYMPNALNQVINFSSLIFVSFTDFVVPWGLYVVTLRAHRNTMIPLSEISHKADLAGQRTEGEKNVEVVSTLADDDDDLSNDYETHGGGRMTWRLLTRAEDGAPEELRSSAQPSEHFALPESWGLSPTTKTRAAVVLVLVMTGLSIYGTFMTIATSADDSFICVEVAVD
eukprot:SAG31_NODE_391_length_16344_cov_15.753339_9_plen_664_part_00